MGHTAWAPEGRERRSQEPGRASSQKSGPGGAPRLLVEYKNDDDMKKNGLAAQKEMQEL